MLVSVSVKDYMSRNPVTFRPGMAVLDAIQTLVDHHISGAPVLDEQGNVVGVLSQKDCMSVALSAGYHNEVRGKVSEYMNQPVDVIEGDSNILEVAQKFAEKGYRRFPVMEENRLIGVISQHDVLCALAKMRGK